MLKVRKPRVCLTADPKLPFGVIDYVAVGFLILGAVWLCSHNVFFLYFLLHGLPTESVLQQMMNVFLFAVTECVGIVILHAQGRTPHLEREVLHPSLVQQLGASPNSCRPFVSCSPSQTEIVPTKVIQTFGTESAGMTRRCVAPGPRLKSPSP
jgi:hypothetical protein